MKVEKLFQHSLYPQVSIHSGVLSGVWLCDPMGPIRPHQAPLIMGFPRQKYWSVSSPGDLPDPGIEHSSLAFPPWQADSLLLYHVGSPTLLTRNYHFIHVVKSQLSQLILWSLMTVNSLFFKKSKLCSLKAFCCYKECTVSHVIMGQCRNALWNTGTTVRRWPLMFLFIT